MKFNIPISVYKLELSPDAVGGQDLIPSLLIETLWTEKIELQETERFEAQKLKYIDPRKYKFYHRSEIETGFLIKTEDNYYTIESYIRLDNKVSEIFVTLRKDLTVE